MAQDVLPSSSLHDRAAARIVLVDPGVTDARVLTEGLAPGWTTVDLPAADLPDANLSDANLSGAKLPGAGSTGNGLAAVVTALAGHADIRSLHILSHGAPGEIALSSGPITLATLHGQPALVAALSRVLADDAEIVLYGCSVAAGAEGAAFVDRLAAATGARVTASDRPVGSAALDADWSFFAGRRSAFTAEAMAAYPGRLATFDFTTATGGTQTLTTTATDTNSVTLTMTHSGGAGNWLVTDPDAGGSSGGGSTGNAALQNVAQATYTFSFSNPGGNGQSITSMVVFGANAQAIDNGTFTFTPTGGSNSNVTVSGVNFVEQDGYEGTTVNLNWTGITSFTVTYSGTDQALGFDTIIFTETAEVVPTLGTPDLLAASDSGTSNTDNITNVTAPVFTGAGATAGNTVHVLVGGTTVGSVTADGSGNWTFAFAGSLAQGSNVITAVQDTGSAESPASTALTVLVDSTAPSTLARPDLLAASDLGSSNTDNITSTTSLQLTGAGSAGDIVSILVGNSTVGIATVSGTGSWSYTATLSDGSYAITTLATDTAGNSGPASAALGVVVDATAPTTLATPDLLAASDLGVSNTDNITSSATQQLTGSAADAATVTILAGTSTLNNVAVSGGSWSYTATLGSGSYAITVFATDTAGNAGAASTALGMVIDTTPPGTINTPDLLASSDSGTSNTDNITNNALPTIAGTGAVANGLVQIMLGASTQGVVTASAVGAWTFTFTATLGSGSNVVTALAQDTAGNSGPASAGLTILVDTVAATLAIPDLVAASDTGLSNTDNVTSDSTPTFGGGSADAGAIVHILSNGSTLGSATATGAGNWSFTVTTTLADGSYAITVLQTDTAGNTGAASSALNMVVDTVAPTTLSTPDLLAASDLGISSTDNITSSTTQQFTGSATDGDRVSILVGNSTANVVTASGGSWSYTHTLAAGSYAITVQATDAIGNAGPVSTALGVVIDTTPPGTVGAPDMIASSDSGTSNTDNITNNALPTIAGTGALANGLVQILLGASTQGVVTASAVGAWTFTFTATLGSGSNVITALAQDTAGNSGPASAALTVVVDTVAATLAIPDLVAASDTGLSNTDNITSDSTPTFGGGSADAGAIVHILSNGSTLGAATATGAGNWSFTVTTTLADGSYAITVLQTDTAGNTSAASSALNMVVDTVAPTTLSTPDLLAASDLGISSSDNITSATTQQFSGSATDGDRVSILVGNSTANVVTASGGSWSYTHTLAAGSYAITVQATDAIGNAGPVSTALGVVIDTTPPGTVGAPDMIASSDLGSSNTDNVTSDSTPTFTGTGALANSLVHILIGGTTVGSVTSSGTGAWTFTAATLAAGTQAVTAKAEDIAGNDGPASATLNVVLDLTAPAAPGTLATPDLTAASDNGPSSTDNNTTDATPTFTGSNTSGSTVHVLLASGTTVGSFTSNPGGTYEVTASSLTAGSYAITIREVDQAGNASADSPALGLTIGVEQQDDNNSGGGGGGSGSGSGSDTSTTVPATSTTTTTTTTNPTTGSTTTTQTQTVQNTSTTTNASAAIVENTNNNGNVVTATLPPSTSISSEGPSTAQSTTDALTTLVNAVDARDSTAESDLISGAQTFLNNLAATTTLDVRTIIPTSTSTSLSSPIVITGTSAADGSTQSEAFVIDMRSLPSGTSLQLDNIEFASIMGSTTVTGGTGANYVTADDSNQFISLGEGNDTLYGGSGNDTVGSGSGDDVLAGEAGDDSVFGGTGDDTTIGGMGSDVAYGNAQNDVVYGNQSNDTLYGGQDSDTLFGGQDNDVVYGNLGSDSLSGQLGEDTLFGGQGDDLLYGGSGNDVLAGNLQNDVLSGGGGDDTLSGGGDFDVLYGGVGDDNLAGGAGDDTLYGGLAGGSSGIDVLGGGDGDDVIYGGEGIDWIYTGSGSDAIYIEASNGYDVVVDFDSLSGDVIHIASNVNGSGIASFADVLAAATDSAEGNVEIDLGSNNFVRIVGVTTSQLSSDMFQFF